MVKCLNVPTRRVSSVGGEGFGEFNATLLGLFSDEDFIRKISMWVKIWYTSMFIFMI